MEIREKCQCPIHGNVEVIIEKIDDDTYIVIKGYKECTSSCPLDKFKPKKPKSDELAKVFDKLAVVSSPRPLDTVQFFSSVGIMDSSFDDETALYIDHKQGDDNLQTRLYFACPNFKVYLQGGLLSWENMQAGDLFKAIVVPKVTKWQPGENTNFNIVNNYLIVPAAGDGTVNVTEMALVEVPISVRTNKPVMPGYWDADYDTDTNQFINIRPNLAGLGKYNMFATEISLAEFIPGIVLKGTNYNFTDLRSNEPMQISHNMGIRIEIDLKEDHDAYVGIILLGYKQD